MRIHSSDLLYSTPKVVTGSKLSETDMLAIAIYRYPNKKHIILKHWIIIDIVDTEVKPKETRRTKTSPTVVYYSLADNKPSEIPKKDIQSYSDYQLSYNEGFFETEETVYLLMGNGFRKTASARLVHLLKNHIQSQ